MIPTIPESNYEAHFYAYPHLHAVSAFRIWGNLYYVGDDNVGIHLIDTGDGLILIDSGYPEKQAWLVQNIWQLGFQPSMIRYLVHTHAHFDHVGCTNLLCQLSPDMKTCLSSTDTKMMRDTPELVFADCHAFRHDCFFTPDIELNDGDEIRLGRTRLWVRAAPGHTMGTLAVFAAVQDGSQEYIAGLHGGLGYNTLSKQFLEKYRICGAREAFRTQLRELQDLPVDIVLGNHTKQIDFLKKMNTLLSNPDQPNPFLDSTYWNRLLRKVQADFAAFEQRDPL